MASPHLTREQLQSLGIERLIDFILQECREQPQFEHRIQRAVAAMTDTDALIKLVKQRLTRLSQSKKFYFAKASFQFADELSDLQHAIIHEVAPLDLRAAIELTRKFLSLHPKIFERVDDSYGNIWPIFDSLLQDLAALYKQSTALDAKQLATEVFDWYCHNNYCIYDHIIQHFAPVLGAEGCQVLEQLLCQPLDSNSLSSRAQHSGRLQLADARQSVDEYIAIVETRQDSISITEQLAIAERLIQAQRFTEALDRLNKLEVSERFVSEQQSLTIRALEGLNQGEDAQKARIEKFTAFPSPEAYQDCLAHSDSPESLKPQLFDIAMNQPQTSVALYLFIQLKELKRAAQLISQNPEAWQGRDYYTLQPAAKALADDWPLEATILYRALIDDLVPRAQSKYYTHAVRYLKALDDLALRIEDWAELMPHEQYFTALHTNHKRKKALWQKYFK